MTSLFMGQLLNNPVPADEVDVRNQATPVSQDKPAAMAETPPEQGLVRTDSDPKLGMSMRQLASEWIQGQPVDTSARIAPVAQVTESTEIINEQVSTSGYSASQEAAGVGHKSLSYAIGIEPVGDLRENGKFGETYFKRNDREIQETAGNYMSTPTNWNANATLQAAATGKVAAREATAGSAYQMWLDGTRS